jgi:hypothetical protein
MTGNRLDGFQPVSDSLDADPRRAEELVGVCVNVPEWIPTNTATELPNGWKYYGAEAPTPPRSLIKGILPETGTALVAGQWGTFKTTIALDLSVSVMAALPFADRYPVKRRGAVLYFALEGEGMLRSRLAAIAGHRAVTGTLPFAWRGDCPPLTDKNAVDILCRLAAEAAADLDRKFGLPVALIWVDTLITAAGYATCGEDNDTAASQKVMTALRTISQRTGALVVGVDHFGKVMETGTRGSSAKEGAADTVIAILADRELSGNVKNTRLAVRKQRDGVSGFELPFTARIIETGVDEDGEPITAPVIDWQPTQQTAQGDVRWTPSMQLLRRVLSTVLLNGANIRPFADGPLVCACDIEVVRAEFYRQYRAEGTDKQKTDARRKAFGRAVKETIARELVGMREVNGVQFVWLAKPEALQSGHEGVRGSGTGQDTPLGVCPCPAPASAAPCGTLMDIAGQLPAVSRS